MSKLKRSDVIIKYQMTKSERENLNTLPRRHEDTKLHKRDREQKTEVRGQKSEDRGQRSEVRRQRSEVRGQISAFGFWLSVFCFLSSASAEWPMFRGNAQRTGFTEGISCLNAAESVVTKWTYHCPKSITFSSPAIGNINSDTLLELVIGCDDYNLYCLRADSGKFLWKYSTGSSIQSSPLLIDLDNDDTLEVVFASFDGNIYAVDGYGNPLWTYYTLTEDTFFSSPVGGDIDLDGLVEIAVGSFDGCLYVLNGVDGGEKWTYITGGKIYSSPALGDLNGDDTLEVIIGSSDHKLYVLQNGNALWTYLAGDTIWSTPALGNLDNDNGLDIVFGCFDGKIYALDGLTGDTLWAPYNVGGKIECESPGLADIDKDSFLEIIQGSFGAESLYCIEGESSLLKWKISPTFDKWMIRTSPTIADIDGDGELEIVMGTHDLYCTAINSNGSILWKNWLNGDPHSEAAIENIIRARHTYNDPELEIVIATLSGDIIALGNKRRGGAVEESNYSCGVKLLKVSPNPFTFKTEIRIQKTEDRSQKTEDRLEIYDLAGRIVKSWDLSRFLRDPNVAGGFGNWDFHKVVWDGTDNYNREVKSGIYFCKLITNKGIEPSRLDETTEEIQKIIKIKP
ncbi:MAG: PQQ-binding-like beta-propeller repeat protein [Candidatus Stahlbacteria bacterium]|nr:PQQ-binding-like beta-propeller repeat protein [Candidatus Stahlbacteria bacterium]